jgi:AAA domain-containing protein
MYPGRIRLREHFRCMPEIIQFSNDLCYQSPPLIPLKQYGGARLTPTVGTHYISDGYVKGTASSMVNETEASVLADELVRCCKDPAYDGKSFGVISLLGSYHSRRIERLLVERLGPEEMERRQIVCGDAYAFQGDERDVIFLSMVSAPTEGRRIGVLSKDSDQQRFNVAASRAREQMILFHSVGLSDLSPSCLRYRLLEYCLTQGSRHSRSAGSRSTSCGISLKTQTGIAPRFPHHSRVGSRSRCSYGLPNVVIALSLSMKSVATASTW